MNFLEKHSTKKNIVIGFVIIAIINLIVFPLFPKIIIGREIPFDGILDLQFGFTTNFAYQLIVNLKEDGRMVYRLSTGIIDMFYLFVYGFTYSFLLINFFKVNNLMKFKYLALLPFGVSFFDMIENIGIIAMVSSFPSINENVCSITSFANQSKWILVVVLVIVFLIGLIFWLLQKFNTKQI